MTPAGIRTARKALGYTQHELAEALRMGAHGWQSISAWESGKRDIPGPVTVAIECLLRHRQG
jgi:transcriptional regulator with XRE-family HTH domain